MTNSFNHEDQQLFDELKLKYSTGAPGIPLDPNAPGAQLTEWKENTGSSDKLDTVSYRKGSNVEAKVCPICQGSGVQREDYNHRRLERMCVTCNGKGVAVYKDGKLVDETAQSSPVPMPDSSSSEGSPPLHSNVKHQETDTAKQQRDVEGRCSKLQADVAQIEMRCAAYEMERAAVYAGLSQGCSEGSAGSEVEAAARQELVKQLDLQLARLRDLSGRKRATIEKLQGRTAECSIDAIIANESTTV